MKQKANHSNKTLLIIVGVIVALLMTYSSPLFTTQEAAVSNIEIADPVAKVDSSKSKNTSGVSSSSSLHSSARLLHFFTKNLPYLNSK